MRKFFINFRKSARDRAAEISARAYNHYLRIRPNLGKIGVPFKLIRNKFYGQSKKGSSIPKKT